MKIRLIFYAILITGLCCSGVVRAQHGNEIVEYTTNISLKKGKLIREETVVIQVNNKSSDWVGEVDISFQEGDDLEILEACVSSIQGQVVRKLKKKDIITKNATSTGTFYDDNLQKSFELKWHQYPYFIKYSYRHVTDRFISLAHWYPLVNLSSYLRFGKLTVALPSGYKQKQFYSDEIQFDLHKTASEDVYTYTMENYQPHDFEPYSPPVQELLPIVQVYPETFNYIRQGELGKWSSFGLWQSRVLEGLDELTDLEKVRINRLIDGATDKHEVIKRLYHYMQDNTRYVNVAVGEGGLKPYPASFVCEKKYGDCKGLTNYMKAMLKYAGIDSYYTKVYSGDNPVRVKTAYPGQQFNHIILCIPLEEDTIWLENTNQYSPYNYLGSFTQNRLVLLCDYENSRLLRTPALQMDEVLQEKKAEIEIDEAGLGMASILLNFQGPVFEKFRYLSKESSSSKFQEYLYDEIGFKMSNLESWNLLDTSRDATVLQLQLEVSLQKQLRKIGRSLVIDEPVFPLPDFDSKPDERKRPVRINYPLNRKEQIRYNLAKMGGYKADVAEDIILETRFGVFKRSFSLGNNELLIEQSLQLVAGDYSVEEYKELYAFFQAIIKSKKMSPVVFNPV